MKLLFFDMEFANGQVPGSVYSLGYLVTDENFQILTPPQDICMAPECEWNAYVAEHILAYPQEEIEASPAFPALYGKVRALFDSCDVAVGFSVGNDVRAITHDCKRYGLEPFPYRWFDVERLCRLLQEQHKEAHGLAGYYTAWCGKEPQNRHRSDGDALATMELMKAICEHHHVTADMLMEAYDKCAGKVVPPKENAPIPAPAPMEAPKKKKKRRWLHRKPKKKAEKASEPQ